jgi:hypothetical protein
MSLLNPPNVRLTAISSKGEPAFKAVNTMMNQTLNQEIIDDMSKAVEIMINKIIDPGWVSDAVDLPNMDAPMHMLSVDKEYKYSKGKEIVVFADGGKGTTGKDLKYVKFFCWWDVSKRGVKNSNDKTYSYSIEKARVFWNTKVAEGYKLFDIPTIEAEKSSTDITPEDAMS